MMNSWGNYPKVNHAKIIPLNWRDEVVFSKTTEETFLPRGQGRSYGDSCLNENGILLTTKQLNRFIQFDADKGVIACEAGVTLDDILLKIIPCGWFLPVLPGTKFVSVGGAIANDVHGKNHHSAGTMGQHVLSFELLRSNGEKIICSRESNAELFQATIGGLGLTGVILSAVLKLKPIASKELSVHYFPFKNLQEFFSLTKELEKKFEYTVAWLDCVASGKDFGRGVFMGANHDAEPSVAKEKRVTTLSVPVYFPQFALNRWSVKAFNHLYFHAQASKAPSQRVLFDEFFFPLDTIKNWNRIYGRQGFVQFQCVLPFVHEKQIEKVLQAIVRTGQASFLSVLKTFGSIESPGLLSFPMEGVTLALDLPYRGEKTYFLLKQLESIVMQFGGKVYPAKDAVMSATAFKTYFPRWKYFAEFIDPRLSSSFWRRVMQDET